MLSTMTSLLARSLAALLLIVATQPAHAEIVLSQVIVDLQPDKADYQDVEIWNAGGELVYVQVEPSEILDPGRPEERRERITDPERGGLLVSPQRLVLEPDERRVIRFAALAERGMRERVYRVAVRPVAAPDAMGASGLKVLLGYDMLILFRPERLSGEVTALRHADRIEFTNNSNFAQEIYDARQCDLKGDTCVTLPATRLYPGASWSMPLTYQTPVDLMISAGSKPVRKSL